MRRWIEFAVIFIVIGVGSAAAVGLLKPSSWVALGVLAVTSSIVALAFLRAANLLGHPRSR
ncbi:MAG: hypothetical protein ACRDKX_00320 [Solirubrobacterales bacterium]